MKYDLDRKPIEKKVTFLQGLRSEWKSIVSTVKDHEKFKSYSLLQVIEILKSHEDEVTEVTKSITNVGPLALVMKE